LLLLNTWQQNIGLKNSVSFYFLYTLTVVEVMGIL
jgi:hypothetical protein